MRNKLLVFLFLISGSIVFAQRGGSYGKMNSKKYGDLSNMYVMSDNAIKRLAGDFPEVKVILMIREPISKLRSLYLFKQREGLFNGSIKEFSESKFFADFLKFIIFLLMGW